MHDKVLTQISDLKHSVDKLSGNISKERKKYNKEINKLQKEYNEKVNEDLKGLSNMIQKIFDIVTLIFKEEEKSG